MPSPAAENGASEPRPAAAGRCRYPRGVRCLSLVVIVVALALLPSGCGSDTKAANDYVDAVNKAQSDFAATFDRLSSRITSAGASTFRPIRRRRGSGALARAVAHGCHRGSFPSFVAGARSQPWWAATEALAHTLPYDATIMGDYSLPTETAAAVTIPTLVLDGGASFGFMGPTADALAKALPNGQRRTLAGQEHNIDPNVLAPALKEFLLG